MRDFFPASESGKIFKARSLLNTVRLWRGIDRSAFAHDYLTSFGYLPRSNPEISNLRREDAVKKALSRLQQFAGLPVTGNLDDATKKLMKTKRCGLPDVPYPQRRYRRYTLQGSKWPRTNLTYKQMVDGRAEDLWLIGRNLCKVEKSQHDCEHLDVVTDRNSLYEMADVSAASKSAANLGTDVYNESFRIVIIATHTNHLGLGRTRRIVHDALQIWADASSLTFTEVADHNADIVVDFFRQDHGDGYPFDGPNVVLAHAFFPGFGRGGDAHFDDDEVWTDGEEENNMVNLFSVAVHEFGHSLGMGHSKVRESLMFPYYTGYMENFKLSSDDIYGIQRLYGNGGHVQVEPPVVVTDHEDSDETTTTRSSEDVDVTATSSAPLPNTTAKTPSLTEVCESSMDAVARIRNEVFVFKNKYFWRVDDFGYLIESPTEIDRFWYGFNEVVDHVDAVYERPGMDKIMFFVGRKYWEFSANIARPGYPRNISSLGLPAYVNKIDAAFVWEYNDKTYFFAGDEYWRFNEETGTVDADYPRKLSIWEGVPHSVDAAFTDHEGVTYFFKNDVVLRFNSYFMRVENDYPTDLRSFWKHCQPSRQRHGGGDSGLLSTAAASGTLARSSPSYRLLSATAVALLTLAWFSVITSAR
ncbi:unnamed protein product [Soboliphyme baturini]|uniref:ZnMc domain-containing protein n=1 Tax=Soboliphyme baturini TaxID=241478 RepID=A0A183IHM5_9BILA|nr:unnamed protein product [Soboliphyme baturini]